MQRNYPFYLKSIIILFGLILFVYAISILREILIPISFSLMLAILLNPLTNWFSKKKVPRGLSIALSMFIAIIDQRLNINIEKQNQWIGQAESGMQPIIGQTLGTVFNSLAFIFLLPVYTFLFLFYKSLILNFLHEVFAEKNSKEVAVVLSQTKGAVQSYMVGLLLEALIVATLN